MTDCDGLITNLRNANSAATGRLTQPELRAMELTAELWNAVVCGVMGDGPTCGDDSRELANHIHAIQHMIMSQAAARAHPELFRLLGKTL